MNFIIGTDAFSKIESWYKANELKDLVHFIIFPRKDYEIKNLENWDYEIADMEFIDISSTDIRNGDKKSKELEEYINKNGLYKI